ncbi:MAG TPA: hypothetical protein DF774_11435 [Rheinheimera sp.]|uniref:site-specific integrase n=1 Tax=Rheinheimera sp. TaxID=1869214 RepID=UPI000EC9960E|nr:tyrosine-type recombinase/integrase [Rheinheimera sp.]HCU66359.1 hypothetical protein [Rheinheimera sp.]
MQSFSSCLYRVPASKNYYFRVRFREFERLAKQPQTNDHFVASLKTSDPDDALLLSRYLITHLKRIASSYPFLVVDVGVGGITHNRVPFRSWFKTQFLQLLSCSYTALRLERPGGGEISTAQLKPQQVELDPLITLLNQILHQTNLQQLTPLSVTTPQLASKNPPKRAEMRLERCVQQFYDSKFREVGMSAQQQYRTSLGFLTEVLGAGFDVRLLTHSQSQIVKSRILTLTSGRKNVGGTGGLLSVKSVNKYLTNMSTFCDWLVEQRQLLTKNPFTGTLLKMDSRTQMRRRAFDEREVSAILSYQPQHKLEAIEFRDAANWLPAIALYSGMRLNEIAGLQLRDVRNENGVWFFDLSNHRLKTENSNRYIPIHSELIRRGLLDYVGQVRLNGHTSLFPDLTCGPDRQSRDGIGSSVGKWFNRTLLSRIGIDKDLEKRRFIMVDFHCCRYTVASQFKLHGVPAYIAKQVLGHELDGDITWGVYAGNVSTKLAALQAAIEVLKYEL